MQNQSESTQQIQSVRKRSGNNILTNQEGNQDKQFNTQSNVEGQNTLQSGNLQKLNLNNKEQSLSSDSQSFQQQKQKIISKSENQIKRQQSLTQNEDVMDQKQQIRYTVNKQNNQQEQTLEEIIKEEMLEVQGSAQYLQLSPCFQKQKTSTSQICENNSDKITQKTSIIQNVEKIEQKQQEYNQKIPNAKEGSQQKLSNSKILFRSMTSTFQASKYLQPNSPQLFISPQSLLPNEVICVQNNFTKVIIHMNKKIVPIPSTALNQPSHKSLSPQKNKQTLPSVKYPYLLGKLVITNYKICYMDLFYPNTMTFCLPLNYIYKLQRIVEQSTGISFIEIQFKTGLNVKFKYHPEQLSYSQKIKDIALTLMSKSLYAALDFGEQQQNKSLRCKSYSDKYFQETNFLKSIKGLQAEIIDNTNWIEMLGYPQKYIVPLRYIGKRNVDTRIVVLAYVYSIHNQKIGLWRTGPGSPDPYEDEWISKARASNKHFVIEIKNKGIGISKSQASRFIEIQNLYLLRQSYQKVHQLTYHSHESMKWFDSICSTRWYQQIAILMNQAAYIIDTMSARVHVTLVSDTESRGAQISAIVQLLMNPYYRTLQGFPYLVQKSFLHYGCPKVLKKEREQDKSIILIQFLDCVYQFTHLYPLSFEFNEYYLAFLAQHVISNKYGNFLYSVRQLKYENQRKQVSQKCVCIWEDIKRKIEKDKRQFFQAEENKKVINKKTNKKASLPLHQIVNNYIYFKNSFYIDPNQSNIFQLRNHSEVSKGIKLWGSYFLKKVFCCQSLKQQILFCNQIEKRYLKIAYQHNLMKKSNQSMRKKLSEQYSKVAQKKQELKSLKQLGVKPI